MKQPSRFLLVLCFLAIPVFLLPGVGKTASGIDCFSCHDREEFQKRVKHSPVSDGECTTCHSPHVSRFKGMLQEEVKNLCYSCHADQAEEHQKGFTHQPVGQGECLGCHTPHASNYPGLLKKAPSEVCFDCHTGISRSYKYNHPPFAKGKCNACHRPHQSENPALLVKEAEALCLSCHPRATVQQKHRNYPAELGNCGSCHNPHGSDRPALVRNILHEPYAAGCNDCHTGKDSPVPIDTCLECHPDVSEQMASSHNHLVRYGDNGCVACHSPHAGDDRRLLKGKERHVCGNCHEATFQRHDSAKFKHKFTVACNDCHAPHGSNHPAMAKAPINAVCSECHGKHGVFTHPIGEKVFDPRTGQVMTCASCHASKGTDFAFHTRFRGTRDLCVQCHRDY